MDRHVRVYLEGGGDQASGLTACRLAFTEFFRPLQSEAASIGVRLDFVAAGGRDKAFDKFKTALTTSRDRVNLLLVDSADELPTDEVDRMYPTRQHLKQRDHWSRPAGVADDRALLIIRALEAWLLLDVNALRERYPNGLKATNLPPMNVSTIDRDRLVELLEKATVDCPAKYRKMHAFDILPHVSLDLVESDPTGKRAVSLIRQHLGLKLKKGK
ncbi:MAG: hypothetical protein ACHQ50_10500 [Fimbriimonadales bacterium]